MIGIAAAAALWAAAANAGSGPSTTLAVYPSRLFLVGTARGAFELRNPTGSPITLLSSVNNFTIKPNGKLILNPRHSPRHSAKRWLAISPKKLTIKPHTSANLDVRSHPAKSASPGDHYAAVLFTTVPRAKGKILVRTRIGITVLVRVKGKVRRRLVIGGMSAVRRSHRLRFSVRNRGNINERLQKRHVTVVLRRGGRTVQKLVAPYRDLLPQSRTVYSLPYRPGLTGRVKAIVTVRPVNGKAAGVGAPNLKPRTRTFNIRF